VTLQGRRPEWTHSVSPLQGRGLADRDRSTPASEARQLKRLKAFKEARDQAELDRRLDALRDVAKGDGNLLPPIKEALAAGGSIGEVCNAMRDVFGEYRGGAFF